MVLEGHDLFYNYEADTKLITLNNIIFDEDLDLTTITEANEEEEENEEPEL